MSTPTAILKAIAASPRATSEEIAEATGIEHVKVRKSLSVMGSPPQGPLVSRALDEVTGKPGYTLTERGRQALAKNAPGAKPDAKPEVATHTADGRQVEAGAKKQKGKHDDSPSPPAGRPGDYVSNEQALLAIIYDIRCAIGDKTGKLMLTELAQHIRDTIDGKSAELDETRSALAIERNARHAMQAEISTERQARQALQEQINADPAVDVHTAARGYAVYSAKLKRPIRRDTAEGAKEAALSHTRSRSATAHVYALVPIGTAKAGAEWRGA